VLAGGAGLAMITAPTAAAAERCIVEYPPSDLDNCPNKRPHPGASPSTNGCGAAGSELSQYIPNRWGDADFEPHCNKHDICYGTCGSSRLQCDWDLGSDAIDACIQAYGGFPGPNARLAACIAVANAYRAAVLAGGAGAFDAGQKEACECCHPVQQVWCGPLDSCHDTAVDCLDVCPSGLGVTGQTLCGPPPEGRCET